VPPASHGVVSPVEPRPDGGGAQPTSARSWRAAPLWDILTGEGIDAIAVGWPGTSCATDWHATVVDDRYAHASATLDLDWPMAPCSIHPVRLREPLRDLRVHPEDLDDKALLAAPAPVLAHAASMHAAATYLMDAAPWRFLAVHYGPLLAAGGLGAALLFDAFLARLQALAAVDANDGCDIVVAGSDGLLAAAGPGFAADVLVHGARPADVTATVFARFGLRLDNAAGRVLDGAGHADLRTVAAPHMAAADTQPARAALLATARHAMADGDFATAAALLEPALQAGTDDPELFLLLGQCRFFLGDWATALDAGRRLSAAWPDRPWGPMMVGAALMQSGDADAAQPYLDAAARMAAGEPQASLRLGAIALHLGRAPEAETHYARALGDPACAADAQAGLGLARLAQGDMAGGEARLRASLGLRYHAPALHHQLGVLYASQGRWDSAAEALRTALAQRPGTAEVEALLDRVTGDRG
jgi:tetratricopeptide (TPR) repeat protein